MPFCLIACPTHHGNGKCHCAICDAKRFSVVDARLFSEATASWNRGINKRHENQLTDYARGERAWSDLAPGAQRRYHEQAAAWKDIRTDFKREAPALAKSLDHFYNPGNKKR